MTNYVIWKPEHDGHAPRNWREGMAWAIDRAPREQPRGPRWHEGSSYWLPPEALNSPNDDASGDMSTCDKCGRRYPSAPAGFVHKCSCSGGMMVRDADTKPKDPRKSVHEALAILRGYSPDELAKHGITLAPEKDWATELWADLMDAWNYKSWAQGIRDGFIVDADQKAIECLRTRFEQMKGEG